MIAAVNTTPAVRFDDYPPMSAVDVICRDGVAAIVVTGAENKKGLPFPHFIIRVDGKLETVNDLGRCSLAARSKIDVVEITGVRPKCKTPENTGAV